MPGPNKPDAPANAEGVAQLAPEDDDDEPLLGPARGPSPGTSQRGPRRGGGGGPRGATTDVLSNLGKLVELVARALVDEPNSVVVRESVDEHHPRIELTVAPDDIGKVIGKDGRTAQSIRSLLMAAAARGGRRPHLDILD